MQSLQDTDEKGGSKMRSKRGKNKRSRGATSHIIIGDQLRRYYQRVVEQPIPDRFVSLLSELGKVAREK